MVEKSSGVLAAIVNLDEEQLHTVDDQGSYGTSDDIADDSPQRMNQPQEMIEEDTRVHNDATASASSANDTSADTSTAPEVPQYALEPTNTDSLPNNPHGSRRARIKNAIASKWKFNRPSFPKKRQQEQIMNDGDIEANYIPFDDDNAATSTPVKSTSHMAITTPVATEQIHPTTTTPPSANLLRFENEKPSSFHNSPHDPPPQLKLSSELFHWYIHRSWKKKLLTLLVVTSSAIVLYDILFCRGVRSEAVVDQFLDWMRLHPVLGIYGYIGVLAVTSCEFII